MQFIKRRIVRPRFVRIDDRAAAPLVAPTPPRVLSGGLPGTELLVLVILSKYMDHLPLYRQAQIFASRYQVELNRKILGNWIRAVAEDWLSIIYHSINQK
jgi:transposase